MDKKNKPSVSTDEIMKAFASNKAIQKTVDALREVAKYKGRDYKTTLTVEITEEGASFGVNEGGIKAGFSNAVKDANEKRPLRAEDVRLGKSLHDPICSYVVETYVGIKKEALEEVIKAVADVAGPAIRHEIEVAVEKKWDKEKGEK